MVQHQSRGCKQHNVATGTEEVGIFNIGCGMTELVLEIPAEAVQNFKYNIGLNTHNVIVNSVRIEDAAIAAANDLKGIRTQPTVLDFPVFDDETVCPVREYLCRWRM